MKLKTFRWNTTGWLAIAFYAVCGLLLLIWPNLALDIANYALAALLGIFGIVLIIAYLRESAFEAVTGFNLAIGLVLVLMSFVLFINNQFLKALLPCLWGVSMIVGGFGKLQMACDLKRMAESRWWLMLIGAAVSFVLGFFSVRNPLFIAEAAICFMGISLLVEAALDTASLIIIRKRIKQAFPNEIEGKGKVQ